MDTATKIRSAVQDMATAKLLIQVALDKHDGSIELLADELGVPKSTLYRWRQGRIPCPDYQAMSDHSHQVSINTAIAMIDTALEGEE